MAALGQYLSEKGFEVSGSDMPEDYSTTSETLKNSNIKVINGFDENNIPADVDLIIYSTAYNAERNVEVKKALERKKAKVMTYPEALGAVFNASYGIAVAGSHGKTTTTAWLGFLVREAGLEPNAIVGTYVSQFGGNSLTGNSDYLIVEVDEYQNKFQYYSPRAMLLNNIDYDHPDFFKTPADYEAVFIEFIKKIPKKGFLIANFDDPIIKKTARVNCLAKIISYGLADETADYFAYDIRKQEGVQYFKVRARFNGDSDGAEQAEPAMAGKVGMSENLPVGDSNEREELGDFCVSLAGKHSIYNALAVIAASVELGIELHVIREHLGEFKGTSRRMEYLGEYNGALIFDDYAHHPTEIKTTLEGLRETYPDKKIITVFHPHTFTRTKALLQEFATCFRSTDELLILDIYGSAREVQGGIHSTDLVKKIEEENMKASAENSWADGSSSRQEIKYIPTLEECENYLKGGLDRNEVCVLMGAGDVFRIGQNLLRQK